MFLALPFFIAGFFVAPWPWGFAAITALTTFSYFRRWPVLSRGGTVPAGVLAQGLVAGLLMNLLFSIGPMTVAWALRTYVF